MSCSPHVVKQYFLNINRSLTIGLIFILIVASVSFWYTDTLRLQNSSTIIGAAFMLIAVIFYQLPYISFLLTRKHFADENREGIEILDSGWKTFRQWLDA